MLRGSRQRYLGVLALLAIAMQMALSFAHTHAGVGHAYVSAAASNPAPAHHPADHDQDETVCLVCLAANQTAATVLAVAQEVACPHLTPSEFKPKPSAPARAATKTANFYARGPPAA